MLQMRQSMPNDLPSLCKYQVYSIHLPQMWMDCDTCQDTNEGETMSRVHCMSVLCPDKEKYNTLIYTITCEVCYRSKMDLLNGGKCKCTLIEVCDYCLPGEEEEEIDYCICRDDEINPNCEWCF